MSYRPKSHFSILFVDYQDYGLYEMKNNHEFFL